MKCRLLLFTYLLHVSHAAFSQAGMWTWVKGSNTAGPKAVFGTKGTEDTANTPSGFYAAGSWTDTAGNFWLYGGLDGSANWGDLWKFNPTTNNWTWVKGQGIATPYGNWGVMGVPSLSNDPGTRSNMPTWTDRNGDLWFFGGTSPTVATDMWRYNIASNTWTWMQGSSANDPPSFGIRSVESSTNSPGGTDETTATWVDSLNNLWLYGGNTNNTAIWRYITSTNNWTWMGGSSASSTTAVYGTQGIADTANNPGSRWPYCSWVDSNWNLWMFGGMETWTYGVGGDVWRYQPNSGKWAWMAGSSRPNSLGVYGSPCSCDSTLFPRSRMETRTRWKDGRGNFWFYGGVSDGFTSYYNDLWCFNPVTLNWTFVNGSTNGQVAPVYGTRGVAAQGNTPGGRGGGVSWINKQGELYLFGGSVNGWVNAQNDVWKFTIDSNCILSSMAAKINLGPDTSYCSGFSRLLNAGYASAVWSTGDTGAQILVTQPGTYWAEVSGCSGVVRDSITISIQNPINPFNLGPDTTYCSPGFSRILVSGNANAIWSTGDTAAQITVNQPGTYWAQTSGCNGVLRDSITISVQSAINPFSLGPDTIYCGSSFSRVPVSGNSNSIWSTGDTAAQITVNRQGTYWASIRNACSTVSDTVRIWQSVIRLQTDSNATACGESNGAVSVSVISGTKPYNFSWNTGAITDTLSKLSAGTYMVTVTDSLGCTAVASVTVDSSLGGSVLISCVTTSFCAGDSSAICAPPGYLNYAWNMGDTGTCVEAKQSGNYYVSVTNQGGCILNSNHININVYPAISVEITVNGDTLRAFNARSYQWFRNDTLLAGETDSIYIARAAGVYTVLITDSNGCSIISNGQVITGITNLQNQLSLKLYPDPAGDELNISYTLNEATTLQITLTDITGRFIKNVLHETQVGGSYLQKVNISQLATGVYIVDFISDGRITVLRFVKD